MMRKLIIKFLAFFFNFFIILMTFICIQMIDAGELKGLNAIFDALAVSWFVYVIINGYILTLHFDKKLKQQVISDVTTDPSVVVEIIPPSWNINIRMFRGALYSGAILIGLRKKRPIFYVYRHLLATPDFVNHIRKIDIISTCIFALLVFSFAMIGPYAMIFN